MKTTAITLSFDRTFEGYLSAVYAALSDGLEVTDIRASGNGSTLLFTETRHIPTDRIRAYRLWEALDQKGGAHLRLVYFAFLSENEALLWPIYRYLCLLFNGGDAESAIELEALRGKLSSWAQRVDHEKRKLQATLLFQDGPGGVKWCRLQPAYNVLPLLTRYCRSQHCGVPWVLMDTKRKFGLRAMGSGVAYFQLVGKPGEDDGTTRGKDPQERDTAFGPQAVRPLQAAV